MYKIQFTLKIKIDEKDVIGQLNHLNKINHKNILLNIIGNNL